MSGDPEYLRLLDEMRELHIEKSSGYGTDQEPLANFFGVAALTGKATYVYPIERSIEKLSRCLSLLTQGRDPELDEEFKDVASLMLCAAALLRRVQPSNSRGIAEERKASEVSNAGPSPVPTSCSTK